MKSHKSVAGKEILPAKHAKQMKNKTIESKNQFFF